MYYIKVVRKCPLEIDDILLEANLVMFKMLGFDVILGMDWLFKQFISIDC